MGGHMKTLYYLDWYADIGFPKKLATEIQKDIRYRKSIVFIRADSVDDPADPADADDVFEKSWFHQAGLFFDAYHVVGHDTPKEYAQQVRSGSICHFPVWWKPTVPNAAFEQA
jgi:hypothetical protein